MAYWNDPYYGYKQLGFAFNPDQNWGSAGIPGITQLPGGSRAENDLTYEFLPGQSMDFTRNGTTYMRGVMPNSFESNDSAQQLGLGNYFINDPEFGGAIPADMYRQWMAMEKAKGDNDFGTRFGPLLAGGALLAGPLATSMGLYGGGGIGGGESAVMGWEETLPGTFTDGAAAAEGGAMDMGVGLNDLFNYQSPGAGAAGGGMFDGFNMPFPTQAPFPPGGGDSTPVPGTVSDPAWQGIPMGAMAQGAGGAAALSRLLKEKAGIDIDPGMLSMLGSGLGLLGGYASAQQSANRAQDVSNQMFAMAERDRQDRMPFLSQSQSWMQDPSSFWGGAVGQELARQTARSIGGSRQENLFDNPTGQSLVMQSLAPQWLNAVTQTANLGLSGTSPLNTLGNIGMQAADARGRPGAVLGAGIADVFGTGQNALQSQNDLLRQIMGSSGGAFNPNFGGYRLG
jgi:hypothetical protein